MVSALLLDRDGVLVARRGYDYAPEHMVPLEGVVRGLSQLQGVRFFIISNQSGVGRGYYTDEDVRACNEALCRRLAEQGIVITDCVYCPHAPSDGCDCRKPKLGMWNVLRERHRLVAAECVVVGDRDCDIAFGKAMGARTALIASDEPVTETPTWTVRTLEELAPLLAAQE